MSDVTSDYERIEKRTRIRGNIRNGIDLPFSVSVGSDRTVPFLLDGTDLRKKLRLL